MSAEARLKQLGITLPNVPAPVANYLPYRVAGNLLFLAGQGPRDENGKLLTGLTASEIDRLFADGTIHGGMLPKIGSALDAVKNGVKSTHIIDGRVAHALLLEVLTNQGVGTMIRADAPADSPAQPAAPAAA